MTKTKTFNVLMIFQYPAWDEKDGILYAGIVAENKRKANARARRMATDDGHASGSRGMYWFKATEVADPPRRTSQRESG